MNLKNKSVNQLVKEIKQNNCDFEWYPTTDEIIRVLISSISGSIDNPSSISFLDVGAGNGKVLNAIKNHKFKDKRTYSNGDNIDFHGSLYAIEKSMPLIESMDRDVFIIGTDFNCLTLIDKKVDVVFSNPPYSEYEKFSSKIITEARSQLIYLVIPQRWSNSKQIMDAIKLRNANYKVKGSFDFLNAERKARAKVDLIEIDLRAKSYSYYQDYKCSVDPFELWFKENFKIGAQQSSSRFKTHKNEVNKEKIKNSIISGANLCETLLELYNQELNRLLTTYKSLECVDKDILDELDVSIEGIMEAVRLKIESLKNKYWRELFDNYSPITSKLASSSRKKLLETLCEHTQVDFTLENITAVSMWTVKNANKYLDSQLIDIYESIASRVDVISYKSNQKTYKRDDWRYTNAKNTINRYKLDYRIICHTYGAYADTYSYTNYMNCNLRENTCNFLDDLVIIAGQLGFDVSNTKKSYETKWSGGSKVEFEYYNHTLNKNETLMDVKIYLNGNIHLRLNQRFIKNLNVEFGRLKGWLRDSAQAADELNITMTEASEIFGNSFNFSAVNTLPALGVKPCEPDSSKEDETIQDNNNECEILELIDFIFDVNQFNLISSLAS